MFTRLFASAAILAAIEATELSTGAELQLEQLRAIYAEVQSEGSSYNDALMAQVKAHNAEEAITLS